MGRAFTEEDLKTLHTNLIESGRRYAEKYGFKKTSIDELVTDVGISKGMFYKFFSSKESFFFEVRETVEKEIQDIIKNIFLKKMANPKEDLVNNFCELFHVIREPKYAPFFNDDELDYLLRRLPKDEIEKDVKRDIIVTSDILNMVGIPIDSSIIDVEMITGVIRSIFLTSMNSRSIGEDTIDRVIRFHIESVVAYVSNCVLNMTEYQKLN